jgi:hypothetical protein
MTTPPQRSPRNRHAARSGPFEPLRRTFCGARPNVELRLCQEVRHVAHRSSRSTRSSPTNAGAARAPVSSACS